MELQLVRTVPAKELMPGELFVIDCPHIPDLHNQVVEIKNLLRIEAAYEGSGVWRVMMNCMGPGTSWNRFAWSFKDEQPVSTVRMREEGSDNLGCPRLKAAFDSLMEEPEDKPKKAKKAKKGKKHGK